MTWLKEWDACVFKTAAAQTAKKKAMAEKRKRARREAQSGGHSYGQQAEVRLYISAVSRWSARANFDQNKNRWKILMGDLLKRSCSWRVHQAWARPPWPM